MMTQVVSCPGWEYENVPGYDDKLRKRSIAAMAALRTTDSREKARCAKDTRPTHARYFEGLTPRNFEYYAGHYRGEDFTCLKNYEVHIRGDRRVGRPPGTVVMDMADFVLDIGRVITELDFSWSINSLVFSDLEKLHRTVELAVGLFVYFLEIHPYANGNGHMARLVLLCILARHEVYPAKWPLHPRPADPPYSELISRYRSGDRRPLQHFVLGLI